MTPFTLAGAIRGTDGKDVTLQFGTRTLHVSNERAADGVLFRDAVVVTFPEAAAGGLERGAANRCAAPCELVSADSGR